MFAFRSLTEWGRHGFDGIDCGQEAYRGACTRNRAQNDNCQSTDGIRCLIVGSRPARLRPRAGTGRRTVGWRLRLGLGCSGEIYGLAACVSCRVLSAGGESFRFDGDGMRISM